MTKKILYIVNVDWFFISHRLPIAIKAMNEGYEVHLACCITDKKEFLQSLGIKVHPISLKRSGTSIFEECTVLIELYRILKHVRPDVSHTVTVKGVIYGGLITRLLRIKRRIASISGLGYIFIDSSLKPRLLKFFIKRLYKLALGKDSLVIFQNNNDKLIFIEGDIINESQSTLIRGSGVNLDKFQFLPEPNTKKITVMFLARLLKDKGLIEFCKAFEIVKKTENARFVLVGDIDPDNPNSITKDELTDYVNNGIEHWGYSKSVESQIPKAHLIVLPSYREGLPKSLLEAAACGRAVVTTDVPGCRDAIEPNVTGLLVKARDHEELARVIQKLLSNDNLRKEFGAAGRSLAEECFDINDVVATHMSIYEGKQ